jgi:hypothetical protein
MEEQIEVSALDKLDRWIINEGVKAGIKARNCPIANAGSSAQLREKSRYQ